MKIREWTNYSFRGTIQQAITYRKKIGLLNLHGLRDVNYNLLQPSILIFCCIDIQSDILLSCHFCLVNKYISNKIVVYIFAADFKFAGLMHIKISHSEVTLSSSRRVQDERRPTEMSDDSRAKRYLTYLIYLQSH